MAESEAARLTITAQLQLQLFGSGSDGGSGGNDTIALSFLDREENFEHLIMLGAVNLGIAIIALAIFIHYWKNFGKGLREYCEWCSVCRRGGGGECVCDERFYCGITEGTL